MSFNNSHFNASSTYNRAGGFKQGKLITALVDITANAVRGITVIKNGVVDVTGLVVRAVGKVTSAATVDATGSTLRSTAKITSNASVDATASVVRGISRAINGIVDATATIPNRVTVNLKALSGIVDTVGTVARGIIYGKIVSAIVDAAGSAVRAVGIVKSASVDVTSSAIRAISSVKSASVDATGLVSRSKIVHKAISAVVDVIGSVIKLQLIGKLFRISITSAKKVMSIISSGMRTEAVITSDDKIEGDL